MYADKDGLLAEQLLSMSGPQAFSNFYDSLKKTREYHQRYGAQQMATEVATDSDIRVSFSGDEVFGMFRHHISNANLTSR